MTSHPQGRLFLLGLVFYGIQIFFSARLAFTLPPEKGEFVEISTDRADPWGSSRLKVMGPRKWRVDSISPARSYTLQFVGNDFEETILASEEVLKPVSSLPSEQPSSIPQTTEKECSEEGICNLILLPGNTIPAYAKEPPRIEAKRPLRFLNRFRICRLGPIFKIQPDSSSKTWLAPSVLTYSDGLNPNRPEFLMPGSMVRVTAQEKEVVPPVCSPDPEQEKQLKTLMGSKSPQPVMGIFLLKDEDRKKVQMLQKENSKQAFELASRLAVQKWVYSNRFCDDPVRQVFLMNQIDQGFSSSQKDWGNLKREELKQKHWEQLLWLHAMMYRTHEPQQCQESLERMTQARILAGKKGLHLLQFGY